MSELKAELIQLKIMYLFMNTDGVCDELEIEQFSQICEGFGISTQDRKNTISFAEQFDFKEDCDNSALTIEIIGTMLGFIQNPTIQSVKDHVSDALYAPMVNENKVLKAQTIWTLINLGYADIAFTEPEKKVIEYLVSIWNIDRVFMETCIDTAETILSLINKKKWINSTDKSNGEKAIYIADIDATIKKMYHDIEISISEADL